MQPQVIGGVVSVVLVVSYVFWRVGFVRELMRRAWIGRHHKTKSWVSTSDRTDTLLLIQKTNERGAVENPVTIKLTRVEWRRGEQVASRCAVRRRRGSRLRFRFRL